MITCKQVATLISSGQVASRGLRGRLEVLFHLWMCKHCARFARQVEIIGDAAHRLHSHEPEAPPDDAASLEARILAKLQGPPAAGGGI